MSSASAIEIAGIQITHPDKVLWPGEGITKGDLARYYAEFGPVLMRYVADRPLTLRPFPRGIEGPGFYLKDAPAGTPRWIRTFEVVPESTGKPVDFLVADDARTLVWLAQRSAIEVHAWLSRTDEPQKPDWAVVDLDPPDHADWSAISQAAVAARDLLRELGVEVFPKLSGQSGMHLLIPLVRSYSFEQVRLYLQAIAESLVARHPDLLTTAYRRGERRDRILFDYAQNAYGKNTVAPYSVRPKPGAPVAVPLTWAEVESRHDPRGHWTMRNLGERLASVGDVLEAALNAPQRLPRHAIV